MSCRDHVPSAGEAARYIGTAPPLITPWLLPWLQEEGVLDFGMEKQLAAVRAIKALRIAVIFQDLADTAIALNDIRGEPASAMRSFDWGRLGKCTCQALPFSHLILWLRPTPNFISLLHHCRWRRPRDQPPRYACPGRLAVSIRVLVQELDGIAMSL